MQITKHFALHEFTASAKAAKLGIRNSPAPYELDNITELCRDLLEPIRTAWVGPLKVTSGYRTPALNKAVGGSKSSAHASGYAADIVPTDTNVRVFKEWLREWLPQSGLMFDQCISERNAAGSEWVHIAIRNRTGKQRGEYLRTMDGVTYSRW